MIKEKINVHYNIYQIKQKNVYIKWIVFVQLIMYKITCKVILDEFTRFRQKTISICHFVIFLKKYLKFYNLDHWEF